MRTIKFRQALYINGKFYKFRFWGFGLIDEPKEKFFMPEISAWEGGDSSIDCLQKPEESMQFTGLTDKNGVEIYEGDIVFDGIAHTFPITVEDFHGYRFMFGLDQLVKSIGIYGQVIGNIYENPELLKEGAE